MNHALARPVVHLVGAGPGDPELLTIKAVRAIRQATVLLVDDLVGEGVLRYARRSARIVHVGKRGGCVSTPQAFIERLMAAEAWRGERVVRLKGGDPFVFGRGGEEAEALVAAGVPFEVVPGVTSALAAAAYAGIPLTHRAHSSAVVFLTGHEDPAKPDAAIRWEDYARLGATLCVYMGMKNLETITRRLQAGGLAAETPVAVVQSATTHGHRQLLSTLGEVALTAEHAGFGAPAMVVIGEVAALADKLAWFDRAQSEALAGAPTKGTR
jgi:uroporphyrin-III C-methyltransferase